MQKKPPQATTPDKHPDEYLHDLNPTAVGGQNIGIESQHPEKAEGQSAFDIKEAHQLLGDLTSDELRDLRVLPPGSRLLEKAAYIDLHHLDQGEFHARAGMIAHADNWYVPKRETSFELWNKLLGIRHGKRTGTEG